MLEQIYRSCRGNVHYWISESIVPNTKTLVLMHGLTADHTLFDKQLEYFAGKYNLIATLGQGEGGLLLAGHTDTVPYDAGRWSKDPFQVTEEGNRLYGLGTIDMKGFFAFIVSALQELDLSKLQKPLRILATADEETTMAGARVIAESQAIKPAYNNLVSKIEGYDGRVMGYKCYVVSIAQSGSEWILKLALSKKATGYDNIILAVTDSEPTVVPDDHVMMYGTCAGMSLPGDDKDTTGDASGASSKEGSYPTFELLQISAL